jgi:WD40 repeat protein
MRVAGYELLEEIARGGMGIVYRARQLEPRRIVALKMLLPHQLGSAEMAARFRLEVKALSELEHVAILPVYQMGEQDGLPFFAMKLATGGTLAERKERYAGNWRAIAQLVRSLAEAVQFAHERGVLHRDLKPGNILFDDRDHAYISDFGLAKVASAETDLTRSVDFLGTPHYVAPEIATRSARQATTASDIYSLGAILYELLAGRPPFDAEGVPALLKKIIDEEPVSPSHRGKSEIRSPKFETNPNFKTRNKGSIKPSADSNSCPVPRDLEVICLKCLAKEPDRRYASARALAEDLERWLAGEPIQARLVTIAERTWKWVKRNPVLATLTGALLLTLIVGGFGLWRSDRAVRNALSATRRAQSEGQENLRAALLTQSRALGAAHASGQRWAALEALMRAAQIGPSLDLRNEAAAALARPDLREIKRFPANISPAGSSVVFTSDLDRYVTPELTGGFALRATQEQKVLAGFPDRSGKPARWFVLSQDDRYIGALLDDYSLEVRAFDEQSPKFLWKGTIRQPPVVEFHPDGKSVAAFVQGMGVFLQSLDGGDAVTLNLTNGRALYLRFNPAGDKLAVVWEPGAIALFRCAGTPALHWTQPLPGAVPWLAWSPDGGKLAAAANDGRGLRIFSSADGQTEFIYSRHLLYPRQFEFDPSGHVIASLGDDWSLRLWDARTGQDIVTTVGRHRVMRFSRDGLRLSTAPTDRELAILERAPEIVFREFSSSAAQAVTSSRLVRSADNRFLLSAHPQLRVYDTSRAAEIGLLDWPTSGLKNAFFDSDRCAILYSLFGKGIYRRTFTCITNADQTAVLKWGEEQLIAKHPKALIWSVIESGQTWVRQGNGTVDLWPGREPERARRLKIPTSGALEMSQDARWAAAPDYTNGNVVIWDCATDRVVTNLSAKGAEQVWFSPDSRWLVAAVESGYCTWQTDRWKRGASWTAHLDSGDPGEISFSDDSRLVAARQERETFQLLSFPDCRELVTLKPPLVLHIHSACLSGDGRCLWLLAPGYRVFEWNVGQLRPELAKLGLDWENVK